MASKSGPLHRFKDVGTSWSQDGSYANAEKLFVCTYCLFDNHPELLSDIAKDFMTEHGLVYGEPLGPRKKGCVLLIVENMKRRLLRGINDRTKKSHNRHLSISRKDLSLIHI